MKLDIDKQYGYMKLDINKHIIFRSLIMNFKSLQLFKVCVK